MIVSAQTTAQKVLSEMLERIVELIAGIGASLHIGVAEMLGYGVNVGDRDCICIELGL